LFQLDHLQVRIYHHFRGRGTAMSCLLFMVDVGAISIGRQKDEKKFLVSRGLLLHSIGE
jgi:hypothetical protein